MTAISDNKPRLHTLCLLIKTNSIDYLDHNLPIPQPNWEPDSTQDDFLDFLEQEEKRDLEKDIEQIIQTDNRERLYSALLKT